MSSSRGLPKAINGSVGSSTRVSDTTTKSGFSPLIVSSSAADSALAEQIISTRSFTSIPLGGSISSEVRALDSNRIDSDTSPAIISRLRSEAEASSIAVMQTPQRTIRSSHTGQLADELPIATSNLLEQLGQTTGMFNGGGAGASGIFSC